MGHHNILLGRDGEARVAAHYTALGYTVLARNWRSGRAGELDLVLGRGDVVVICEVKTRSSTRFGHPAEAVDPRKQRRIRGLAVQYLTAHPVRARVVRFDVATVLAGQVEVIEAAF